MARLGMDVDLVEQLGRVLLAQASQLEAVLAAVDTLAIEAMSAWDGPDAQQFTGRWMSEHRVDLGKASQALQSFGQSAIANAADQRSVSGH